MKKIWVDILNEGEIKTSVVRQLKYFYKDKRYNVEVNFPQDRPAQHNRNKSIKEFLKSDFDYYVVCDYDIVPLMNPLDLVEANKDVIGCLCLTIKENTLLWVAFDYKDNKYQPLDIKQMKKDGFKGFMEVDVVGSGCMIIKREVLEKVKAPFERQWDDDGLAIKGLDFYFCEKAKKDGFKVWIHSDFIGSHYKTVDLLNYI